MKEKLLIELYKIIGINILSKKDLINNIFSRDLLLGSSVIKKYKSLIPLLKKFYPSCKLTCLHSNSASKQKFIAINMLRQISKENKLDLVPITKSNGYHPITKKKLVNRYYQIKRI